MEVKINKPDPVPQPPKTYDLIGLTAKQAEFICVLVSCTNVADAAKMMGEGTKPSVQLALYEQLRPLCRDLDMRFSDRGILRLLVK